MTSVAAAEKIAQTATPDLAVDLAHFVASIDAKRLDAAVVKAVKTNILDTLSCALAGASSWVRLLIVRLLQFQVSARIRN